MTRYENINDIMRYFDTRMAHYSNTQSAQFVNGSLSVNLSSEYTQFIREAARCNRYASDVIYDIEAINRKLDEFNGNSCIFALGFRKDGVDGNGFILSRCEGNCYNVYKNYFAIYFVEIKEDVDYDGFWEVETHGWHV